MMNMPPVTKNLIIINLLFFLAKLVAVRYGVDLDNLLGLHFFLAPDFNFYQFFTYMFMHGGVTHILFNMFAVWMFGRVMESYWGGRRFLLYYVVCGLGAGLDVGLGAGALVLISPFICIAPCIASVQHHRLSHEKGRRTQLDPPPLAFRDGWQILRHVP